MSEYRTDDAFAIVPMWLIESKVSDRALRLYSLLSGMRDYGTDMATVGRGLLASKLGCSADSLDRAKLELETVDAITVERGRATDGQIARNVYTIHRARPDSRTADGSRTHAATPLAAPERQGVLIGDESSSSSPGQKKGAADGRLPKTVGGKRVTSLEHDLVDALLGKFNERAGKRYAGREWREAIVRRIREHPDMPLVQHLAIIDTQFDHPWWKGDATPSVIWGNGRVFDRALNGAKGSAGEDEGKKKYTQ